MTGLISAMLHYYSYYHLARTQRMNGILQIVSEKSGTNENRNCFLIIYNLGFDWRSWSLENVIVNNAFGHNVYSVYILNHDSTNV
jgi:hypothetical protein